MPIVNENDATATDEIAFGDNDALAAHVAVLVRARLLVLLTEVDGVYTRAPGTPDAELVREGSAVDDVAFGAGSALGRGGMRSKVAAARMASEAGIPTVIADGTRATCSGRSSPASRAGRASTAPSASSPRTSSGCASRRSRSGRLHVDDGARRAVAVQGRSLLAVGVVRCEGDFEAGDAVELVGPDGVAVRAGRDRGGGVRDLRRVRRGVEAVHRDRLVVY